MNLIMNESSHVVRKKTITKYVTCNVLPLGFAGTKFPLPSGYHPQMGGGGFYRTMPLAQNFVIYTIICNSMVHDLLERVKPYALIYLVTKKIDIWIVLMTRDRHGSLRTASPSYAYTRKL